VHRIALATEGEQTTNDFFKFPMTEPDRPFRILFHIDDFGRGGTETALISWLNTLDRRLFSPSLAVTYPTDDLTYWRGHSIPEDVPIHILASSWWMCHLHRVGRRRKLAPLEKIVHKLLTHCAIRPLVDRRFLRLARKYDVVCDFDLSMRRIVGRASVPCIGISHYSFSARWGKKPAAYVARRVKQLARYAAIAVLTPDMLREARHAFCDTGVRLEELPNVIDIKAIRQKAESIVRLPPSPFLVSVARLDEGQKDHATLLRAYAKVRAHRSSMADLVLIGDGPDREGLERLVDDLGIRAFVRFLGFCPNPFPYIRAALALVLSSRYEGFGMVLGEAMALGTPVISTDCPTGPRDLLDGGKAGLLVAPGDVDGMADAIDRLASDSALRETLRTNASDKVQGFAPDSANRRMLALLRQVGAPSVGGPAALSPAEADEAALDEIA
jgi:glycosyltransferase involved in cell wall biosynthesis